MQFFLDTANLEEIRKAKEYGLIDGVTTNPTLLSRESGDWKQLVAAICREVEGPVSLEVFSEEAEEMLAEARELVAIGPNVVVKCPCTANGLKACKKLAENGINVNMTLVFSPLQALLAAKAGAAYVSPFVGRLDAVGHFGMDLVKQIVSIYENYDFSTQVLVASIRNPTHVLESALIGADVATVPFSVLMDLLKHPLTEKGLRAFVEDAAKLA
ncbi:fructose-6-phosphate aldolase [Paucidesulfovibrio longus]|uniref:fructose-6-phosphate aldolase n=1 Tax=Paucidesulfovibrio longus TaxID=889 RepID=UPI0003B51BF6|nr:fructose-6-phosphate aldolase [Paucidesulfovibrio longus]